jgi:hypothetical protein
MSWTFLAGLFTLGFLYGLVSRRLKMVLVLSAATGFFATLVDEAAMLAAGSAAAKTTRLPLSLFIHHFPRILTGGMVGLAIFLICGLMQRKSRNPTAL